uniref:LRR receptor-like serine/threonine-protein kinase GSO1 n=1 Tax=Rhizophora mucronata TaxID=61149 RepID=A0A2P2JGZ2_RHIMU
MPEEIGELPEMTITQAQLDKLWIG